VKVKAGEKVPFDGILLTSAALAKTLSELDGQVAKLRLELEAVKREALAKETAVEKKATVDLNLERERRAALEGDLLRRSALYEKSLERMSSSEPWYKSGYLTMGLGIILGGGICAGTAAAIGK
jgi:hypothetical protein